MLTSTCTRCRLQLALAAVLWFAAPPCTHAVEDVASAVLSVTTDFPGGSAEVQSVDAADGEIHIWPAVHEGRGWPCWWYLRVAGLKTGQAVTLKVSRNPQPFRDDQRLAANWAQPQYAALSTDNQTFVQTPKREMEGDTAVYRLNAPGPCIWLASQPPFLPADTDALLSRIVRETPGAERFMLARTREGRPVEGLKLGGGTAAAAAPWGVWVQARQHAWEAGSSWVARGLIEWAASNDPAAVAFRNRATIYVVPIMDVDNVMLGAGGKEAVPRDHNRDWDDRPVYPEVAAAQQRLRDLDALGQLHVFIDLHNPGPGEPQPYFYGPSDLDQMPTAQQQHYTRLLGFAAECICDPLPLDPKYHFTTYVQTEEELRRMSGTWVRNHTGTDVVAVSLETVWDTPHSTQEGYQAVGRQLAQTVDRYLAARADKLAPVRIALVGDSTVASYAEPPADRPSLTGWGQVLEEFFNDRVSVLNHAASGRSSKSFIGEGLWQKTLEAKPDYVFVQFGHNDEPGKGERSTDANTDYRKYLSQYIQDAKAVGATPVLVTSVARRTFQDGKPQTTLQPYVDAMKKVGQEQNVPVIDLHGMSLTLLAELGEAGSADLSPSPDDRSHFSRKGARTMARLVAEAVPTAVPALRPYLAEIWFGNRVGITDSVPAPWTPLVVEGSAVKPWGRTYQFDRSLLPTEVVTREASVLAAPISIRGRAAGKPIVWNGQANQLAVNTPATVSLTGRATAESLVLTGQTTVEYDGMVRVDLVVAAQGEPVTIEELLLEMPVRPEHARYLYHFPGQWGSVSNSGYVPADGWTHAFKPFVWLGDEDRGLAWFCESDENWSPADPNRALTIARSEDRVMFCCHLIERPTVVTGPLKYTFGFQATPVKNPEKTVWDYRITHSGNYGLERQSAQGPDTQITYPADGHVRAEEGTFECWYRPAYDTERELPVEQRKHMANRSLFTIKWGPDIQRGTNCGLYWNELVQGPVVWSRKDGKVLLNPGAAFDWKAGQWYHLALTWSDKICIYIDGRLLSESPNAGFIPAPLDGAVIEIGGASALATIDEVRILGVARPPAADPGAYEPDEQTLLLEHFDNDDATTSAATGRPGAAHPNLAFVPAKFGLGPSWEPVHARTELQRLAARGVRTICFHEHWSPYQSHPYVTDENRPKLRSLVDGCHEHGIGLLLYMSRQFADNAPEWERYSQEVVAQPHWGVYQRQPAQTAYGVCWNTAWKDFCLFHLDRLLAEFGHDGWYLDGPEWPVACTNQLHGCGYRAADGTVHPTYDIFATRDFMKRLYVLTRQRRPEGQLNIHNSTVMVIPTLGWGTSTWGGEQIDAIKPPVKTLDILPMDAFRTEFMGRQWGVPSEFLVYDGQPYYAKDVLAYTLLHGVLIRPSGPEQLDRIAALWKVYDEFPFKDATLYPYWNNAELLTCEPAGVYATAYQRPGEGLLIFVSNLTDHDTGATVTLHSGQLNWPGTFKVWDALSRAAIASDSNGKMQLPVTSWGYRVVRVQP